MRGGGKKLREIPTRADLTSFQILKDVIKSHRCTRIKTHKLLQVCKQVVTSLFTSCQQVVFALLVPSLL